MNGTKNEQPQEGILSIYDPLGNWYQPDPGSLWICPGGHVHRAEELVGIYGSRCYLTCPECFAPEGVEAFDT